MNFFRKQSAANRLNEDGIAPIHAAASVGAIDDAKELLAGNANMNFRSRDGRTALHFAAASGELDFIRFLLASPQVDVNARDDAKQTAMHHAAKGGYSEIAKELHGAGVDLTARNSNFMSTPDLAVSNGHVNVLEALADAGVKFAEMQGSNALLAVAALSEQDAIVKFLLDEGIPVDVTFNGYTPLMRTNEHRNLTTARTLLDAGAVIDTLIGGSNVLCMAIIANNVALVMLLLEYMSCPRFSLNEFCPAMTPLQIAVDIVAKGGNPAMVTALLDAGANPLKFREGECEPAVGICSVVGRRDLHDMIMNHLDQVEEFESIDDTYIFIETLPLIKQPLVHEPVSVPLLVNLSHLKKDTAYSHAAFFSFGELKGWRIADDDEPVRKLDGKPHTLPQLASFLQEWLYFGLLRAISQVLDMAFDFRDHLRKTSGGDFYIYTKAIDGFSEAWRKSEESRDYSGIGEDVIVLSVATRCGLIKDMIQLAQAAARKIFTYDFAREQTSGTAEPGKNNLENDIKADQVLFYEFSLAIILLGDILLRIHQQIYDARILLEADKASPDAIIARAAKQFEDSGGIAEDYIWSSNCKYPCQFIVERMRANGRCPTVIYMLNSISMSIPTLYYLSLLHGNENNEMHSPCSYHHCTVNKVNDETYETKHAESCQSPYTCKFVSVDRDKMVSLLKAKKFPVVKANIGTDGDGVTLSLQEGSKYGYTAISHVWGQGMGNPNGNSLPECQIRRLNRLVCQEPKEKELDKELDKENFPYWEASPWFWIDTLCVPSWNGVEKTEALALMSEVYQNALNVRVLDSEVSRTSVAGTQAEMIAKVLLSDWMRRLWTLQEGLLPELSAILFQFLEHPLHYHDLVKRIEDEERYGDLITNDLVERMRSLLPPVWRFGGPSYEHGFIPILQTSCFRETSKPVDEFRCFATLLGLDIKEFEAVRHSDPQIQLQNRQVVFYQMMGDESNAFGVYEKKTFGGIPPHVLFMDGPRLNVEGFRWAPATFLAREPSQIITNPRHRIPMDPAFVHDKGLRIRLDGWMLDVPITDSNDQLGLRSLWGKSFAIENDQNGLACIFEPFGREWEDGVPSFEGQKIAILTRSPELDPYALFVVVSDVRQDYTAVHYGWRSKVFSQPQRLFRAFHKANEGQGVSTNSSDTSLSVEALRTQIEDLQFYGASQRSERKKWLGKKRLYSGGFEKDKLWVIL